MDPALAAHVQPEAAAVPAAAAVAGPPPAPDANVPAPAEVNAVTTMAQLMTMLQPFIANVSALATAASNAASRPASTSVLPPGLKMPTPPYFDGKSRRNCSTWLTQVRNWLIVTGVDLSTLHSVRVAANLLSDSALQWFQSKVQQARHDGYGDESTGGFQNFDEFAHDMELSLGDPLPELKARKELHVLTQTTSVLNYASTFARLISFIPNLDPGHLSFAFWFGLKPKIKEQLSGKVEDAAPWQEIRTLAHRFDTLAMEQRSSPSSSSFPSYRRSYSVPRDNRRDDPMDLGSAYVSRHPRGRSPTPDPRRGRSPTPDPRRGRSPSPFRPSSDRPTLAKLTPAEREQLRSIGACFRCRKTGHFTGQCPLNRAGKYPASNAKN